MITASCHCGAVRLEVQRVPRTLTACNCSICRRYGALWAHYKANTVRVSCGPGAVESYAWGRKALRFFRCRVCGVATHHQRAVEPRQSTIAVNANNMDPSVVATARIRRLDGAATVFAHAAGGLNGSAKSISYSTGRLTGLSYVDPAASRSTSK
jgi:hypothetical protein